MTTGYRASAPEIRQINPRGDDPTLERPFLWGILRPQDAICPYAPSISEMLGGTSVTGAPTSAWRSANVICSLVNFMQNLQLCTSPTLPRSPHVCWRHFPGHGQEIGRTCVVAIDQMSGRPEWGLGLGDTSIVNSVGR